MKNGRYLTRWDEWQIGKLYLRYKSFPLERKEADYPVWKCVAVDRENICVVLEAFGKQITVHEWRDRFSPFAGIENPVKQQYKTVIAVARTAERKHDLQILQKTDPGPPAPVR